MANIASMSTTAKPSTATRLAIEPEMVHIPPDKFLVGSPESEAERWPNEGPQHEVTIAYAFEMSKYEITFDEYNVFVKATNRDFPHGTDYSREPVVGVSFEDAQAYVQWLSQQTGKKYRLPTEAEWEYTARAGTQTRYWWGDDVGKNNAVCLQCGSQWDGKQTAPVGSFKANAFGLHDTAGNVREWVQDCWHWHENVNNVPTDGSAWLEIDGGDCTSRMVRSGSWNGYLNGLESTSRYKTSIDAATTDVGFRIARDF